MRTRKEREELCAGCDHGEDQHVNGHCRGSHSCTCETFSAPGDKALLAQAAHAEMVRNKRFVKLLELTMQTLEMEEKQLADLLGVSKPTVGRWLMGKNLPRSACQEGVTRCLLRKVVEETMAKPYPRRRDGKQA